MGVDLGGTIRTVDGYLQGYFDIVYGWIINSIDKGITNTYEKSQNHTTSGMIIFIASFFFNAIRILFFAITLSIVIIINVVIYIVSNYHRWILLIAVGVFALCLFVIFYLWDIVRKLINNVIIPGINGVIRGIANFVNPIVRAIRKLLRLRIDEMNDSGISGEVPSLPSIAKAIAKPLLELMLTPLRAGPDYYK
jgi:hypothetical protein